MSTRMSYVRGSAIGAAVLAVTSICAGQSALYVDDSAPAGGDGLSWQTAYDNLQDALDHDGGYSGEIRIAQGNYVPSERLDPTDPRSATFDLHDGAKLFGGYGGLDAEDPDERDPEQYVTVLNGDLNDDDGPNFQNYGDNVYNVLSTQSVAITLDGLTTRGGNATGHYAGGGISASNSTIEIRNSRFIENRTSGSIRRGGAMRFEGDDVLIEDTVIANNRAVSGSGGGLIGDSDTVVTLRSSQLIANEAAVGGGANFNDTSAVTIENCEFTNNIGGAGGGAVFAGVTSLHVLDSSFVGNDGGTDGGGISGCIADITVMNSSFILNESTSFGGGVSSCNAVIANCIFSVNSSATGGGIAQTSNGLTDVFNSTIHGNTDGGGIGQAVPGNFIIAVQNSILRNNLPDQIIGADPTFVASYSNIQGVSAGTNIDADPIFVQPGTHNFRLHHDSPSINAGNDALLPEDVLDMDDDFDKDEPIPWDLDHTDRVQDGAVDHGAFEGGHDMQAPTAGGFLDPGDNLFLVPSGGTFDPVQHTGAWVANIDGQPGAYYEITELTGTLYPGAPGHHQLGTALDAETDITAGDFMSVLFIPFDQSDLDGADPLSVNLTRYDPETGRWILAVAGNEQNSPAHTGPIGDRHILDDPESWWNAVAMGNYGVYWDDDAGAGYVFAIVDRDGQFAFGDPTCPGDVYPAGVGDDTIDGHDLGLVLSNWGVGGEFGPADLNLDGIVDGADLGVLVSNWGQCDSGLLPTGLGGSDVAPNWGPCAEDDPCVGDLTGDHAVTGRDLGILLAQWGDCPQRSDCIADLTGNGRVSHDDLAALLGTAE